MSPIPPKLVSISPEQRELMLAEYKTLRDEQLKRMDHRVLILTTSLTIGAAALGFGLERQSSVLLLVTPVITVTFGLLVVYHTWIIGDIGSYLDRQIEKPLAEAYPSAIGWHDTGNRPQRFRRIFAVFHLPMILVTLVPAVAAIVLGWTFREALELRITLTILDTLALTAYVVAYIHWGGGRSPSRNKPG